MEAKKDVKKSKIDAFNQFLVSENLSTNKVQNLWKKEILKDFASEKTARRKLRSIQLTLSKHLLAMQTLKDAAKLKEAKQQLADFYKTTLVDKSRFTNVSKDNENFKTLNDAYEVVKNEI